MPEDKRRTPRGVKDILEKECAARREAINSIHKVFKSHGYFEIQTPTYEFAKVFSSQGNKAEKYLKFFDSSGKLVTLRPDITAPIARVAATKLEHAPMPRRLCYFGNAYVDSGAYSGALQNEFTQAGIELIGASSASADAEVIAVTTEALLAVGLSEFQIELGQAEYFKGLMRRAELPDEIEEEFRRLIHKKSLVAVEELAEKHINDKDLRQTVLGLPNRFGDVSLLKGRGGLGTEECAALDNLSEIYDILCKYGYEKYITIDLGLVSGLDYYTGVIIKGFARGIGFPICGGGRYDNLIGEFGRDLSATGVAIGVDRLMSVLPERARAAVADTIVCCSPRAHEQALSVAKGLRRKDTVVQLWLETNDFDGAREYAKTCGIGGIVQVMDGGEVQVVNLADGNVTETTIEKLLGQ